MTGSGSDKRRHPRQKVLKGAKIIFIDRSSLYDCQVRDWSDSGARLVFPAITQLPARFNLAMRDGTTRECRLVRSDGLVSGVEFLI